MTERARPLLVGEDNPYGSDPRYALYPEPEHSAGGRLCRLIFGLGVKDYIRCFDRVNLCSKKWSAKEAKATADRIRCHEAAGRTIVLLGSKVAGIFRGAYEPFTVERVSNSMAAIMTGDLLVETTFVVLPHPSGRNRMWNEPGAFERARAVLTEAGVLPVPPRSWEMPPTRREWCQLHNDDHAPTTNTTTARPAYCDNCGKLAAEVWCDECGAP